MKTENKMKKFQIQVEIYGEDGDVLMTNTEIESALSVADAIEQVEERYFDPGFLEDREDFGILHAVEMPAVKGRP